MHIESISASEMIKMLHWQFFHSILVTVGISLIKLSMARFLLRLVPGKGYKYFLYGMIGMFSQFYLQVLKANIGPVFLIAFTFSSAGVS
jgi:hypothetical protein